MSGLLCCHIMADDVRSVVLSHVEYCPVVWSSAVRKHTLKSFGLVLSENTLKLQVAPNRAARLALICSIRSNVMEMHKKLSRLTVEAKFEYHII